MICLSFNPFPVLETKRLILRQLKPSDDKLIFNYQSSKENFKYVDMPVYIDIEEAQNYIEKMNKGIAENKWVIWAMVKKEADEIIGTISLWNFTENNTKAELGYGLYPGNRGQGYMSEALNKVTDFGLNDIGLTTVEAYTNKKNDKSISLLKRNGFIKKADFVDSNTFSGKPMEMVIYAKS